MQTPKIIVLLVCSGFSQPLKGVLSILLGICVLIIFVFSIEFFFILVWRRVYSPMDSTFLGFWDFEVRIWECTSRVVEDYWGEEFSMNGVLNVCSILVRLCTSCASVVECGCFTLSELFPIAFGLCFTTTKSISETKKIASKGGEYCT